MANMENSNSREGKPEWSESKLEEIKSRIGLDNNASIEEIAEKILYFCNAIVIGDPATDKDVEHNRKIDEARKISEELGVALEGEDEPFKNEILKKLREIKKDGSIGGSGSIFGKEGQSEMLKGETNQIDKTEEEIKEAREEIKNSYEPDEIAWSEIKLKEAKRTGVDFESETQDEIKVELTVPEEDMEGEEEVDEKKLKEALEEYAFPVKKEGKGEKKSEKKLGEDGKKDKKELGKLGKGLAFGGLVVWESVKGAFWLGWQVIKETSKEAWRYVEKYAGDKGIFKESRDMWSKWNKKEEKK